MLSLPLKRLDVFISWSRIARKLWLWGFFQVTLDAAQSKRFPTKWLFPAVTSPIQTVIVKLKSAWPSRRRAARESAANVLKKCVQLHIQVYHNRILSVVMWQTYKVTATTWKFFQVNHWCYDVQAHTTGYTESDTICFLPIQSISGVTLSLWAIIL